MRLFKRWLYLPALLFMFFITSDNLSHAQKPTPHFSRHTLDFEGHTFVGYSGEDLRTDTVGVARRPLVVFVHGTPGDWKAWEKYLKDSALVQHFRMLAIDRPGFGESDSMHVYTSLEMQARVVHEWVRKFAAGQAVVIVGHSYGGPVAARYGIDFPDEAKNIVLLAPAVCAQKEKPRWYNQIARIGFVNKHLGQPMRITNQEMMALPPQLEAMEPHWGLIRAHVWLFHGKMDMIAPYGNAIFVQKHIAPAQLTFTSFPYENHFIPWTRFKEIRATLLGL